MQLCGDTPFTLRLLSVLFGLLAIFGMYLFCVEAFSEQDPQAARRIGLLVATLMAVSAFQMAWSRQVRMYALGTALTALSTWALVRALRSRQAAWHAWLMYAALALACAYTHYYALFTIACQYAYIVGCWARQKVQPSGSPAPGCHCETSWSLPV